MATLASDEEIEMKERMNNGTKHEKDHSKEGVTNEGKKKRRSDPKVWRIIWRYV